MNKTTLNDAQKQQIDDLIEKTLFRLTEDGICEPDMSDMQEDHQAYDDVYGERMEVLFKEALNYLKNNLL